MGATPGPEKKGKPGKDPFMPPLDEALSREFFRRLEARPVEAQEAFVKRVNWNLVDPLTEYRLFGWLLAGLLSGDVSRERFAIATLDKLPHPKRARHADRFAAVLDGMPDPVAQSVRAAFGPVLGGPPKRKAAPKAPPKKQEPPKEASVDDLQRLQQFFNKGR